MIVFWAPDERRLRQLLRTLDRTLFRASRAPARCRSRGASCTGRSTETWRLMLALGTRYLATRATRGVAVDDARVRCVRRARRDGTERRCATLLDELAAGRRPDAVGVAADDGQAPGSRPVDGMRRVPLVCTPGAAAVVAEAWIGAARGARHAVCLLIGERVDRRHPARRRSPGSARTVSPAPPPGSRSIRSNARTTASSAASPRKSAATASPAAWPGASRPAIESTRARTRRRSLDAITGGARVRRRAQRRRRRDIGGPRHREVHRHGGREPGRRSSIRRSSCSAAPIATPATCCSSRFGRSSRAGCRPASHEQLRFAISALGERRASRSARRGSRCSRGA